MSLAALWSESLKHPRGRGCPNNEYRRNNPTRHHECKNTRYHDSAPGHIPPIRYGKLVDVLHTGQIKTN
ncbi:MAG: hypothetical protein PHX54_06520 [Lentimicrobiaceae bacterium]|nr:hypothetical protein [Lentimicrobiaceae bacterium]